MTLRAQRGVQPNAQQPRVFDALRICPQQQRDNRVLSGTRGFQCRLSY